MTKVPDSEEGVTLSFKFSVEAFVQLQTMCVRFGLDPIKDKAKAVRQSLRFADLCSEKMKEGWKIILMNEKTGDKLEVTEI